MSDGTETVETDEADTPEDIRLAKEMGWREPAEWKGEPPKTGFLPAKEYIRRGEKIMPIIKAQAKKWEDEARNLRAELDATRVEQRDTIKRIERMSTLALDQQRSQLEERYAARKEAAVEVGDKAAYQQAVKDEREANKALNERLEEPEPEKGKKAAELPKSVQDTIDAWRQDNPWYSDDATDEMTAYATARHGRLLKEKKGLTLKENLEQVAADVRKRFPEQFGEVEEEDDEPKTRRGSPVEGGSRNNGGGKSLASKLPADAKVQALRFIREDGLFLEKGETAEKNQAQALERYAKQYFGDER